MGSKRFDASFEKYVGSCDIPAVDMDEETDIDLWHSVRDGKHYLDLTLRERLSDEDYAFIQMDRNTPEDRRVGELLCNGGDIPDGVSLEALNYMNSSKSLLGGYTPLIVACVSADEYRIQTLLEAGADPNLANGYGVTPLHFLLGEQYNDSDKIMRCVKLLIDAGADPTLRDKEKDATPFQDRFRGRFGDTYYGEGIYSMFDCVSWTDIESTIQPLTVKEEDSCGNDEERRTQLIVRGLVDLGWGEGANDKDISGKNSNERKDRLQLINHLSAPSISGDVGKLYLYYWDERDGENFAGWWVADSIGSNYFVVCCTGVHNDPDPPAPSGGAWQPRSMSHPYYDDFGFVQVETSDGKIAFTAKGSSAKGHTLENKMFVKTDQIHMGKHVFVLEPSQTNILEERCLLLCKTLLMPLLRMAANQTLHNTEEYPCKAFLRYLLDAKVATVCQERVLEEAERGLTLLADILNNTYLDVRSTLSDIAPKSELLVDWSHLNQVHVHGRLEWLESLDMTHCIVILSKIGYTLEEICLEMTSHGWTDKSSFFPSVYALWLIKSARECNDMLNKCIFEASGSMGKVRLGPIKGMGRIIAKQFDYADQIYNGISAYRVGGIIDIARLSISFTDPNELKNVFQILRSSTMKENGFETVRVKNGFNEDVVNPAGGYRDVKLNVLVQSEDGSNVTIAEVQLLLKEYMDIKKHMHILYEVKRGSFFSVS